MLALLHLLVVISPFAGGQPDDEGDDVKAVLLQLRSPYARVRKDGLQSISGFGRVMPAEIRYEAIKLLKDTDDYVRESAVSSLIWCSKFDEPLASALGERLRIEPVTSIRKSIAQALGAKRPKVPEILPPLYDTLKDTEAEVRSAAAYALLRIAPQNQAALPVLFEIIKDRTKPRLTRLSAVTSLRYLHRSRADEIIPLLIDLVSQRDSHTDSAAANVLGSLGPAAKVAVPCLIARSQTVDDPERSWYATQVVRIDPTCEAVVPVFMDELDNRNVAGRFMACMGFSVHLAATIPTDLLRQRMRFDLARSVESVLVHWRYPLRDDRHGLRGLAADDLGRMGPVAKPAVPALEAALRDKQPGLRLDAAGALGRIVPGHAEAIRVLVELMEDEDSIKSIPAIVRLGRCGPSARSAIPALERVMKVSGPYKGLIAAAELVRIDPDHARARAVAFNALKSKDEGDRLRAARALGELGPKAKDAVPALKQLLKDEDDDVRDAAEEALKKIEGS